MRASLLDRVDLPALRAVASGLPGPWGTVVACLLAPGVVQHDPADPGWPDRDRLVVADPDGARAVDAGLQAAGHPAGAAWHDAVGGPALAVARGMAAASDLDGGIFRVWCLLGEGAVDSGELWEAAADAAGGSLAVVALVTPPAGARLTGLLETAGWRVHPVRAGDALEVLGGLDHVLLPGRPGALVALARRP